MTKKIYIFKKRMHGAWYKTSIVGDQSVLFYYYYYYINSYFLFVFFKFSDLNFIWVSMF